MKKERVFDIYLASSWRNNFYLDVLERLKKEGYNVYDFRHRGFSWTNIDPNWLKWSKEEFIENLDHPIAEDGFNRDWFALNNCDICVLVNPCNRSAHSELGYCRGRELKTFILLDDTVEPELMYKMYHYLCIDLNDLIKKLKSLPRCLKCDSFLVLLEDDNGFCRRCKHEWVF
jgi:hypothetical protein